MPVAIEYALVRQDTVGSHQVLDHCRVGRPCRGRSLSGRSLMCGLGVGWRGFHGAPRIVMAALLKAFFVWMRRLVAAPFPLTLSLSRKGRGNPTTISS